MNSGTTLISVWRGRSYNYVSETEGIFSSDKTNSFFFSLLLESTLGFYNKFHHPCALKISEPAFNDSTPPVTF